MSTPTTLHNQEALPNLPSIFGEKLTVKKCPNTDLIGVVGSGQT
jgi:hypothetical protein